MALTSAFHEAVEEKNKLRIRIMMKDSLLVDPTFTQFGEMERAASSVEGLYEPHDGREFKEDKEAWDDDYMNELMVQVVSNFSHERVNHLKEVVRRLRPVKNESKSGRPSGGHGASGEEKISYQEQKRRDQENGSYRGCKIAAGAVVGAVAGGVVAAIVEAPVAVGALAGAAIAGGAVYMTMREE